MKRCLILMLLTFASNAFCQPQPNLGLIPTPQNTELRPGTCNPAKVKVNELKVAQLPVEANPEQSYQLTVESKAITIKYVADEGLQNARLTLEQLKTLYGDKIPCLAITDWPAYKWRGWMDDISRGPVPHAEYRKLQWATLHSLKYNFCNYYTEHTLYQTEFPDLAPEYAAKCKPHSDEFINLQLFAHAEKTLRIPFYRNLMDSKANFNPDNEETYTFLFDRICAAIKRVPDSPFFIINCDETEQLGSGRAKKLVDDKGADQVYIDHINRCYEIIEDAYFRYHQNDAKEQDSVMFPQVVMWGDIVAKNPQMMKQLPSDMVYIMWAYEPLDSYDHLIKPFREQGNPFWVAPSLSHSSNTMPNPVRYMKNIANLARDGQRGGAEGLMNTCWDDNGEALFDNCWHGLYWSAEMAWNPIKTANPEELKQREEQFNKNFERLFYKSNKSDPSDKSDKSATPNTSTLYTVGSLETDRDFADLYVSSALWSPLLDINPVILNRYDDRLLQRLGDVESGIDSAANPHAHYTFMRLYTTISKITLQKAIDQQLRQGGFAEECQAFASTFFHDLKHLKREYLRLWDQENGDYERHIVTDRYDNLAQQVLDLEGHVFVEVNQNIQNNQTTPMVTLRTLYGDRDIYYTLDGSEPTAASTKYTGPFALERSATIRAVTYNQYGESAETTQYLLSHLAMGAKLTLATKCGSDFRAVYSGGGDNALIDGLLGSNTSYTDGHWQGYWGDSIDARIDFGSPREINSVSMRFVQNTFDWVLAPKQVRIYTSADGKEWQLLTTKDFTTDPRETGFLLKHYSIDIPQPSQTPAKAKNSKLKTQNYQFLRVVVPSGGPLPEWHTAPGQPSWLFCDEIIVK